MRIINNFKITLSKLVWSFATLIFLGFTPIANAVGLKNPLSGIDSLAGFVKSILDIVVMIGIPVITLAIIYAGFLFVKAKGDPKELETAKSTLLYTVIGAAIILGSWVLALAICNTVADLGSSPSCQ